MPMKTSVSCACPKISGVVSFARKHLMEGGLGPWSLGEVSLSLSLSLYSSSTTTVTLPPINNTQQSDTPPHSDYETKLSNGQDGTVDKKGNDGEPIGPWSLGEVSLSNNVR